MKKILVFLVAFIMVLGICGCSKKDDNINNNQTPENNTTTQPTQNTTNSEKMVTVPLAVFNSNNEMVDVGTFTFEYNSDSIISCTTYDSNSGLIVSKGSSNDLGYSKNFKEKIETGMFDYFKNLNNMAISQLMLGSMSKVYFVELKSYKQDNDYYLTDYGKLTGGQGYGNWNGLVQAKSTDSVSSLNIGYENIYLSDNSGAQLYVNLSDEYWLWISRSSVDGKNSKDLIMETWNSLNFNVSNNEFIKLYTQYRYTGK